MTVNISDAEKLARAVLLWFDPGAWGDRNRDVWRELTGTDDATTKTLCDLARKVRSAEERKPQPTKEADESDNVPVLRTTGAAPDNPYY